MRNKPYVAAAAIPAALLLWWAITLWWSDNAVLALLPGALAAALFVGAYRISQAASFAPAKKSQWGSSRSEGVTQWLDARSDDADKPAPKP